MTERGRKYLFDIFRAIDLIEGFLADTQEFHLYQKDMKTQSAVERQLVILGEALKKLKEADPDIVIHNDNQIIGLRNRLVHGYNSVDNAIIWAITQKHLKELKLKLNQLTD